MQPSKFRSILEGTEILVNTVLRYVFFLIVVFGLAAATFSLVMGEKAASVLATETSSSLVFGATIVALMIIWREVREIRKWLEGISKAKSSGIYSKYATHVSKSKGKK